MSALIMKNRKTGKTETIQQYELTKTDWGFRFFVASELDAYKAAYQYRYDPNGVKVEFAGGAKRWMVTVFNATAAAAGIDGAK